MFTGIVEEKGRVVGFSKGREAWRLRLAMDLVRADLAIGDSVAVNGCCLTVSELDSATVGFDVLEETRRLTNLSDLESGAAVNLERSLRFDGRMGGHFVSGHIDGCGEIEVLEARGKDYFLQVAVPRRGSRYLVHKGSIAIDGVSLTVAEVSVANFAVWLIPHTLAVTNLGEKDVGQRVNLEYDLLGKYVEKFVTAQRT